MIHAAHLTKIHEKSCINSWNEFYMESNFDWNSIILSVYIRLFFYKICICLIVNKQLYIQISFCEKICRTFFQIFFFSGNEMKPFNSVCQKNREYEVYENLHTVTLSICSHRTRFESLTIDNLATWRFYKTMYLHVDDYLSIYRLATVHNIGSINVSLLYFDIFQLKDAIRDHLFRGLLYL